MTNLYFAAKKSPLNEPIIALNGSGQGLINNVCVLSDVAPGYAPKDQALLSISLLGKHEEKELSDIVKKELHAWFGEQVQDWRHLRTDLIRQALPEQPPNHSSPGYLRLGPTWLCGDHTTTASIEGAIISGTRTATAVASELASNP